jgi:hypothetical protein
MSRSACAACASSRSTPAAARRCSRRACAGGRRHGGRHRVDAHQEGPGGRPRVPAHQPPARLPGLRQGRRVPAAGPDDGHGPGESRFVEEKRHFEKPIPISDLVYLDRERCILCDRCTRFADEVAGDPLIHFIDRGNTPRSTPSPTSRSRRTSQRQHRADLPGGRAHREAVPLQGPPVGPRPEVESTCTTCSVGCRIVVQSSRNEVLRYQGVDSDPVNWGWLCDKGRFDFEAVNSEDRLSDPLVRTGDGLAEPAGTTALAQAAAGADRRRQPAPPVGRRHRRRPLAPTRTPTPGPSWPRASSAPTTSTPSSATACPPRRARPAPATIDDACARHHHRAARPGPQGRAAGAVPALRDAAEKRRRMIEFTPKQDRPHPYAWKSVAYEPGTQVQAVRDRARRSGRGREQLAAGDVVVVAGRPTSPRPPPPRCRRCTRCSTRRPRGQGPAGVPSRQRGRRSAGSACPAPVGSTPGHPAGRRRGQARAACPARRRPARPTSPTPTWPPSAGRRASVIASTPSSRPSHAASRRRAAGCCVRREVRHHHEPRGPRLHARPARSPGGHQPDPTG